MPTFKHETLRAIGDAIFQAAGCTPKHTRIVVDHLIDSSLAGHDSHGILRFHEYVPLIREGRFDPDGEPTVVRDRPCTAVVDGGGGLGQVGALLATQVAIEKARRHGTGTVALRNTSHVGRVGAYPLMAAEEGLIGLAVVNAGHMGFQIAPHGGLDGKLSTDPIAFAAPRRNADPILVDMATSMVSEGKLRFYRDQQKPLADGWIIDHSGCPTTDPGGFLAEPRGAILPLGGASAHKGYCLGVLVEVLGGAVSGQGCANGESKMQSNGMVMTVYDLEHFTDRESYYDDVETLIRHIHTSRIDPAMGEIQIPGEPEFRTTRHRRAHGIEINDTTWSDIAATALSLGLDPKAWEAAAVG